MFFIFIYNIFIAWESEFIFTYYDKLEIIYTGSLPLHTLLVSPPWR